MKKLFVLNITWCPCFLLCCKVSACAWWTLSFHSRRLWGPGWGSALTRGSNVDETGQHSVFGATCICLVWCSSPEEWEITISFVSCSLSCLLGCKESLLLRGCAVPHATRPLSKVFSGAQTVEWVGTGEMWRHRWPVAHQDDGRGAFLGVLRGGKEISVVPWVMVAPAAGTELESPKDSCVLGRF